MNQNIDREELLTVQTKLRKLSPRQLRLVRAFISLLIARRRLIGWLQGSR